MNNPGLREHHWKQLQTAYCEPHRSYHNLEHIAEMLEAFDNEPNVQRSRAVRFAILYHDAVYVPGDLYNEQKSARLAIEHAREYADLKDVYIGHISELILLTSMHGLFKPKDLPGATAEFLDIDMMRLGAPAEHFDRTSAGIDFEFKKIAETDLGRYLRGRRAFFVGVQNAPSIFLTDRFRHRFEAQARKNITRAVERLDDLIEKLT